MGNIKLETLEFLMFDESNNWEEGYFNWLEHCSSDSNVVENIILRGIAKAAFREMHGRVSDMEALAGVLSEIVSKEALHILNGKIV